ncbi:2,3-dihydro-2,3-dihydroxybenzoate dehydrogenase [Streptomyces yaizuensis]|uniref:2,3-dihydro-2,3-dihydroxybenzoate dehydrogenase n=1 Tax=Streptomyces yaizuensis TaxID=2989713 RepID=A0ABQ5PA89_9ACTN|nr:2,3-dihydro-2,3-dihydroxybenzoate dehydrogenase [Streptomyces sp. YSPA8]GLF99410.1 2,3-dihydro-2,3-dihydroxybenzoate dehydrogenase [Streptomyces sp. YSPA8]
MKGKTALVTGAAGGIGASVARALGEQGVRVAAVDRDADRLRETARELTADGHDILPFPADVTSAAEVDTLVDTVERELGPLDHLVNAAGVLRLGRVDALTDEDWTATFGVNTLGVFLMSRAVATRMTGRNRGAIVTVASNAATTPRVEMAAYSASKAAAAMFTKCLGLEVARHGIRCNVVAPGSTDTPMLRAMWHDETGPEKTVRGSLDAYRLGIPLEKVARPADVADAVVFLLSDQAAQITLHTLTVDGGATLGT